MHAVLLLFVCPKLVAEALEPTPPHQAKRELLAPLHALLIKVDVEQFSHEGGFELHNCRYAQFGRCAAVRAPAVDTRPALISLARVCLTAQIVITASTGALLLSYTWLGLQLIYPTPLRGTVARPGLFTIGNVEDGTAAAINEDGTRHSKMSPAARGSLLDLYGTGFGAFTSNLATGEYFSKTAQVPLLNPVSVTIGGEVATVEFAGGVPGMIAGTTLIRVRVPEDLPAGAHKVAVAVEGQQVEPAQRVTV